MSDFPYTLGQLFQMYHRQLGYGFIAASLCALHHWHDGQAAKTIAFDSAVCACLAFGVDKLLMLFGLKTDDWGFLTSVFIGVFGWRVIWAAIKNKLPTITNGSKAQ